MLGTSMSMNITSITTMVQTCSKPKATKQELEFIREHVRLRLNCPNAPDQQLRTACHHAVIEDQPRILEILVLMAKGSLDNHDSRGCKPEDYAKNEYMRQVITELRKEKQRVLETKKTVRGHDLYHLFTQNYKNKYFLDGLRNWHRSRPEDFNKPYYWDQNLCHLAAKANLGKEVFHYLVMECQIDLFARDRDGCLPYDLAEPRTQAYIREIEAELQQKNRSAFTNAKWEAMFGNKNLPNPSQREVEAQEDDREPTRIDRLMSQLKLDPVSTRSRKGGTLLSAPGRTVSAPAAAAAPVPLLVPLSPAASSALDAAPLTSAAAPLLSPRTPSPPSLLQPENSLSPRRLVRKAEGDSPEEPKVSVVPTLRKQGTLSPPPLKPSYAPPSAEAVTSPRRESTLLEKLLFTPFATLSPASTLPPAPRTRADSLFERPRTITKEKAPVLAAAASASLPVVAAPAISMEDLIANDALEAFRAQDPNPNGKLKSRRPFITEAFLQRAGKIFMWLLEHGARLEVHHLWLTLLDFSRKHDTAVRTAFLKSMLKEIDAKINYVRIDEAKKLLTSLEEDFEKKLVDKGLDVTLTQISIMQGLEKNTLGKLLHDICSGIKEEVRHPFDAQEIKKLVIGLLAETSAVEIIETLIQLYPHFKRDQKLVALFIVKEIIRRDDIHHCFQSKRFANGALSAFFKLTEADSYNDFNTMLQEMIRLRKRIADPLVSAAIHINAILSRTGAQNENIPLTPSRLAKELSAISSEFYHTVQIKEFTRTGWAKNEKLTTSPNIVYQTDIFNKMSVYFIVTILQLPDDEERTRFIELLIHTLHELLHGKIVDLNSAMAIAGALNDAFLAPYLNSLSDKDLLQKFQKALTILSPNHNYSEHRRTMANPGSGSVCIPFMGVYTRDLTFTAEKSDLREKAMTLGNIFISLMQAQESLDQTFIPCLSTLLYELDSMAARNEEILELLAFKAKPKDIRLDFTLDTLKFTSMITIYAEKKHPLRVKYRIDKETDTQTILQEAEGFEAIEAVTSWLQKNMTENTAGFTIEAALAIFEAMRKLPNANDTVEACQKRLITSYTANQATQKPPSPPLLLSAMAAATSAPLNPTAAANIKTNIAANKLDPLSKGKARAPSKHALQ